MMIQFHLMSSELPTEVFRMIKIDAFEMKHLATFEPKEEYEDIQRDMGKAIRDVNKTILTIFWKEAVLCIVGVSEFRKGAGEVWLLPSVHVDSCKMKFFKTVKSLIYEFVFPVLRFHRLEIAILQGWEKGMKWAKALGFKESHVCEAYDSQYRDHVIFYRIA